MTRKHARDSSQGSAGSAASQGPRRKAARWTTGGGGGEAQSAAATIGRLLETAGHNAVALRLLPPWMNVATRALEDVLAAEPLDVGAAARQRLLEKLLPGDTWAASMPADADVLRRVAAHEPTRQAALGATIASFVRQEADAARRRRAQVLGAAWTTTTPFPDTAGLLTHLAVLPEGDACAEAKFPAELVAALDANWSVLLSQGADAPVDDRTATIDALLRPPAVAENVGAALRASLPTVVRLVRTRLRRSIQTGVDSTLRPKLVQALRSTFSTSEPADGAAAAPAVRAPGTRHVVAEDHPGASSVLDFLLICGQIKETKRAGWVLRKVPDPESVGDHMFRMAQMAFLCDASNESVRKNRVFKIALVHDLGEAIVGDITPHDGVAETDKHRMEEEALAKICSTLENKAVGQEIVALWREYEAAASPEARLVKDFDKFDMILQAYEYEKRHAMRLDEFFETTKGRFKTDLVKGWVAELAKRRDELHAESEPAADAGAEPEVGGETGAAGEPDAGAQADAGAEPEAMATDTPAAPAEAT